MNANELPADQLADLLDEIPVGDFESLDHHHFTRQAATMLRQQQAEINTLRTHGYKTQYELLRLEFLQQQAEIEALKKTWFLFNQNGYAEPFLEDRIRLIEQHVLESNPKDFVVEFAKAIEKAHGVNQP